MVSEYAFILVLDLGQVHQLSGWQTEFWMEFFVLGCQQGSDLEI